MLVKCSVSGCCLAFAYFFANFSLGCLQKKACKSVWIASCTYRFCWKYAIILVWKTWSSSLNQLNVLIYFNKTFLSTVYRNDWLKLSFICFSAVPINQLSYLICFCYNFFFATTFFRAKKQICINRGDYVRKYWLVLFF